MERPLIPSLPTQLAAAWPLTEWDGLHVAVAVSGGADSMALLRALLAAKREGRGAGRVFAVHVNHGLRGAESDADEAWLRQQCAQLDVSLVVRRCDAAARAADEGDGVEAAARSLRYELLADAAHELGARFVATAHTRDDQVETVLFRLLRGSGLRGLAGMPRRRSLSPPVTLVRPLLGCTRADVVDYLQELGQPWREDATNATASFARNRIRRELLPLVRDVVNADADAAIARAAEQAGEVQELVDVLADELLAQCRVDAAPADALLLEVAPLAGRAPLLVCEVLRRAWREAGWSEQAMTHGRWLQLAALAGDDVGGAAINLPRDVRARREGGKLKLEREGG